jgi:hypothetical protein
MRQRRDQVRIHDYANPTQDEMRPVATQAAEDWVYATMSEAAYGRVESVVTKRVRLRHEPLADMDSLLHANGWRRWEGFPTPQDEQRFQRVNLRVEVWAHVGSRRLVVAFGGSTKNLWDWVSNLRWILPPMTDQYTEVMSDLAPAFQYAVLQRIGATELANWKIFTTGHSLGGGLAQCLAQAMPIGGALPRVAIQKVFAFDASPVTGADDIAPDVRAANWTGLAIDQIYEQREMLFKFRRLHDFFVPPQGANPHTRDVRYALFGGDSLSSHSMEELAVEMQKVAGVTQQHTAPASMAR